MDETLGMAGQVLAGSLRCARIARRREAAAGIARFLSEGTCGAGTEGLVLARAATALESLRVAQSTLAKFTPALDAGVLAA